MKRLMMLMVILATYASATEWKNVTLVDTQCAKKVANNPDAHTRDCALQCSKAGMGIVTPDGKFLKFDNSGNQQAVQLLKETSKKDHLRVTVDGDEKDGTIAVKSVKFE